MRLLRRCPTAPGGHWPSWTLTLLFAAIFAANGTLVIRPLGIGEDLVGTATGHQTMNVDAGDAVRKIPPPGLSLQGQVLWPLASCQANMQGSSGLTGCCLTLTQVVMSDKVFHSSGPNRTRFTRAAWMPQFSSGPISHKGSGAPVSLAFRV